MSYTFEDAAISYLDNGGEGRYLDPIVDYFSGIMLNKISPFDIRKMANDLYPWQSNATKNRHAITPTRAVLSHGYDRGWCQLMRIKRFKLEKSKPVEPATPAWMFAFIKQCETDGLDHLAALVLFMQQTAARISEAVSLQWNEVDLLNRRVTLLKTKTYVHSHNASKSVADRFNSLRFDV